MSALAPSSIDIRTLRQGLGASSTAQIYLVLLLVLIVTWGLILATGGNLNITNTLVRSVALGVVAVGQTFVILGGSLDLSVAQQVSVTAVVASVLMDGDPGRIWFSVPAVVAIGVIIGAVNGLIITAFHIHAFIATLGTTLILQGILNATFDNYAGAIPSEFQVIGYGSFFGIPYAVFLLLGMVAAGWFVLRYTRFGHHLYAVGESPETARLSGVRSNRVIVMAHIICSLMAVLTGLYLASRLGQGAPWVGPNGNYDLESIAAVVLGGTALAGGRGGVLGTFAGVLILALVDNAFNQLQINPFLRDVVRGGIIIAAVAAYAVRQRRDSS